MSEEILVRQGAPTLAGIKTGSLFPCPCEDKEALFADIRRLNRLLVPKGLCLLPIRFLKGQVLLYLYRPSELRRDLENEQAAEILHHAGYNSGHCGRCIANLIRRFREGGEFPHEVGLFLSYPPEDVKGFIDHRACNFKCAGLWKVYGDEQKARELFARFKKCTEIYCALWQTGSKLEQLAVAGLHICLHSGIVVLIIAVRYIVPAPGQPQHSPFTADRPYLRILYGAVHIFCGILHRIVQGLFGYGRLCSRQQACGQGQGKHKCESALFPFLHMTESPSAFSSEGPAGFPQALSQ